MYSGAPSKVCRTGAFVRFGWQHLNQYNIKRCERESEGNCGFWLEYSYKT